MAQAAILWVKSISHKLRFLGVRQGHFRQILTNFGFQNLNSAFRRPNHPAKLHIKKQLHIKKCDLTHKFAALANLWVKSHTLLFSCLKCNRRPEGGRSAVARTIIGRVMQKWKGRVVKFWIAMLNYPHCLRCLLRMILS